MNDLVKEKIEELVKNPTVTDTKLTKFLRESARERIASALLWMVGFLYSVFLLIGSFLVYTSKIQFRDLLDLILALGVLAGFLGTAINFYFKD